VSGVEDILEQAVSSIPGGHARAPQVEMLRAVAEAVATGQHLAVEGPTGVGKSLAYLVPVLDAARDGQRTIIVTATRALQDQLALADLPVASAPFADSVSWAVLKGRNNYLCQASLAEVTGSRPTQSAFEVTEEGAERPTDPGELEALLTWAGRTHTGDRVELPEEPSEAAWAAVSVGAGECPGAARCDHADQCWSEMARDAALDADVVVVNAHLYAAHLQSGGTLLGDHQVLVVDEAHEFEDALVGALGISVSPGRLRAAARAYGRLVAGDPGPPRALERSAEPLEDALRRCRDATVADGGSSRITGPFPRELSDALNGARLAVAEAISGIATIREAARQSGSAATRHRSERTARAVDGLADDLDAISGDLQGGQVRWISEGGSGRLALELTRIDIAETLQQIAWHEPADSDPDDDGHHDRDHERGGPVVVMCSATLDPSTAERLGLSARYLAVDSPFDVRSNGLLYVPRIVRPNDAAWPEAVADELCSMIELLDGRTLGLFTSRRMLARTAEAVRSRLPGHRVLVQGDAPNPVLQREFIDDEHASLLATASFWTGISAPGPTCSAVVIDKLPFPVPSDPIVQARSERVGADAAFGEVSIPAAAIGLAQGAGRLLRTTTDRGVVVVLDSRLAEARYRRRILDRLPPFRRTREPDDVVDFVSALRSTSDHK